ncbi:6-bladed beta-propeller protein [Cyclobacterium xiamenense]|uniref:6-bladed beta-propeller protein n=1 Tax=Cyclobacterium xiamenense TaxID=1297121 RepID=A0A1H6V1D6_9BACT|nr:6-bladed beta-propeller [Cyclobacterium xiamenense]SEI94440.1 6-bladed beta-propeller protein [Cyclobacterium xiamenense]
MKIKRKFTPLIFLCFFLFSCNENRKFNFQIDSNSSSLEKVKISALSENLDLLGEITSFALIDDSRFVVSTLNPSKVFIFNFDGQQVYEIAYSGIGPNEFMEPSIVRSDGKRVFVWCRTQLKLLIYDLHGKPIDEYKGYKKAVVDFLIKDEHILFYTSGGFDGPYVSKFKIGEHVSVDDFGFSTESHKLLAILACSGGMAEEKGKLFFSSPAELSITIVDLDDHESKIVTWNDPEFRAIELQESAIDIVNNNRNKMIDLLNESSLVTGVFKIGKHIILKAEVGEYSPEDGKDGVSKKRFDKYYEIDENFEILKTYKEAKSFENNNCLYQSYEGNLYYISIHSNEGDYQYWLNRLSFK